MSITFYINVPYKRFLKNALYDNLIMREIMFFIDKNNIGTVIKNARKKAGLKQYELAEMAGFSEKHLCRIENGKYLPKLEHFLSIVSILNLKLEDFGINADRKNISQEKNTLINKILTSDDKLVKIYFEIFENIDKIINLNKNKMV